MNPVLVDIVRGALIESRHRGSAVVSDAAGKVVLAWGDVDTPIYGRSAVKPLQAIPLVESGAADRFGLGTTELALACASHHGEAAHVAAVSAWLARLGLGPEDLECGAHPPAEPAANEALIRAGIAPTALHNNCSGKHAGFLTLARHLGVPTAGYIAPDHPVQQRVTEVLATMTGTDLSHATLGIDGCGIPVWGIPLRGLARAMARTVDGQGIDAARAAAARRLSDAMAAAPLMVSGSTGANTRILAVAGDRARPKFGAEGVCCAALPQHGWGLALKVDDGGSRAVDVVLGAVLRQLKVLDEAQDAALAEIFTPPVKNVAGLVVGALQPATKSMSPGT